jgi:hypothetical protein
MSIINKVGPHIARFFGGAGVTDHLEEPKRAQTIREKLEALQAADQKSGYSSLASDFLAADETGALPSDEEIVSRINTRILELNSKPNFRHYFSHYKPDHMEGEYNYRQLDILCGLLGYETLEQWREENTVQVGDTIHLKTPEERVGATVEPLGEPA